MRLIGFLIGLQREVCHMFTLCWFHSDSTPSEIEKGGEGEDECNDRNRRLAVGKIYPVKHVYFSFGDRGLMGCARCLDASGGGLNVFGLTEFLKIGDEGDELTLWIGSDQFSFEVRDDFIGLDVEHQLNGLCA